MTTFEDRLLAAFPDKYWSIIVRAQREGIVLADDVRRNTPMLSDFLGRDLSGQLRRIGIMHRFAQLCSLGELPFKTEVLEMPYGSWHWLEVRSATVFAHIVRTPTVGSLPVDTPSRQIKAAVNQGDLFAPNVVRFPANANSFPELYGLFTFGADNRGMLTHSAIGLPSADNMGWLAHRNLLESRTGLDVDPIAPLKLDPTDRIKFREHVELQLNEKGKKAKGE